MAFTNLGYRGSQGLAEFFFSSTTWVCAYNGRYRISALGAGGSGGVYHSGGSALNAAASGGGGGGFCETEIILIAGYSLVLTVGAGTAVTMSSNGASNGVNGGTTTVVLTDVINLSAGGGNGGTTSTSSGVDATGGAGGTATGGTLNITGGAGGTAKFTTSGLMGGGGGASGSPYGTGGAGGEAKLGNTYKWAGGGGAVGGYTNIPPSTSTAGGGYGAGTGGNSIADTTNGPPRSNISVYPLFSYSRDSKYFFEWFIDPFRSLSGSANSSGAGTYGKCYNGASQGGSIIAGVCGGGGSVISYHTSSSITYPATSTGSWLGGGSGGAISICSGTITGNTIASAGGNGIVVIERIG